MIRKLLAVTSLALVLAACGDEEKSQGASTDAAPAPTEAATQDPTQAEQAAAEAELKARAEREARIKLEAEEKVRADMAAEKKAAEEAAARATRDAAARARSGSQGESGENENFERLQGGRGACGVKAENARPGSSCEAVGKGGRAEMEAVEAGG